jgi:hypothetical protein
VLGAVHLAGDVVLEAPGVELVALDGPPWLSDFSRSGVEL